MKGSTMSAEWRYLHGVGPEPRHYHAEVRSCPDCGTDLTEAEGGMRCPGRCQRQWSWAELRNSETGD